MKKKSHKANSIEWWKGLTTEEKRNHELKNFGYCEYLEDIILADTDIELMYGKNLLANYGKV